MGLLSDLPTCRAQVYFISYARGVLFSRAHDLLRPEVVEVVECTSFLHAELVSLT